MFCLSTGAFKCVQYVSCCFYNVVEVVCFFLMLSVKSYACEGNFPLKVEFGFKGRENNVAKMGSCELLWRRGLVQNTVCERRTSHPCAAAILLEKGQVIAALWATQFHTAQMLQISFLHLKWCINGGMPFSCARQVQESHVMQNTIFCWYKLIATSLLKPCVKIFFQNDYWFI